MNTKRSCELLKVPRSSYYEIKTRKESTRKIQDKKYIELIRGIWLKSHKRYGSPKIHSELRRMGKGMGINKVQRLMRENEMRSVVKTRFKPQTVSKVQEGLINELDQDFKVRAYGEKIVSDITYIKTSDKGWCYLCSYMDLYNNEILSWIFEPTMDLRVVLSALKKIPAKHLKGSFVHTDRGSQYTSMVFRGELKKLQVKESFSRRGNPHDNACIESFHAVLKKELIYPNSIKPYEDMKLLLFEYIESWYNRERIQKRLGYLSPINYLKKTKELEKKSRKICPKY